MLCLLLAGATIGIYWTAIGHPFLVLDDRDYVTANPHVKNGLAWSTITWALTATDAANWHPLTWVSHALDCQLFGLNAAGHHFDNILIHAANAVLLFLLLAWVTKRMWPSWCVAALFAWHTLNVESVAWIAERKNVLSTLFLIAAIAAYAWYARRPNWRRYSLVALLFALGLMAKPMVITLPFVFLLLDYWPLERWGGEAESGEAPIKSEPNAGTTGYTGRHREIGGLNRSSPEFGAARGKLFGLVLEKLPLLLLSAGSAWITLFAERGAERTVEEFPIGSRMQNAIASYGLYLWKTVWPARLGFYPHSVSALPAWEWMVSAAFLLAVTVLVIVFRKRRYLAVGWLWFLGTLVPVIGLVQVGEASMADRYAYVPLIGIFIMSAFAIADFAAAKKARPVWLAAPALCAFAALASASYEQIDYWESDYDLWAHALDIGETPFTHNALGVALMNPDAEMSQVDMEPFASGQQRMEEARRHFERALELRQAPGSSSQAYLPDLARTLNNLGNVDRLEGRIDEARRHCEAALEIYRRLAERDPDGFAQYLAATLNNLGQLDRTQNRTEEARRDYEESLRIQRPLAQRYPSKYLPNLAMTLNEYGRLHESEQRSAEAQRDYEEALNIDRQLARESPAVYAPDLAMTLNEVGVLDATENHLDDARAHYEEALQIRRRLAEQNPAAHLPDLAMALANLANLDGKQNRMDQERAHFQEALGVYRRLAEQTPTAYMPYVGETLAEIGFIDRDQNRLTESRARLQEALIIFHRLREGDAEYGREVAAIEATLRALGTEGQGR